MMGRNSRHARRLLLAALGVWLGIWLGIWAQAAAAGEWFTHDGLGELRAYHGDWLAVCADGGAGACRAVQTAVDPGSSAYFDLRLALHRIDGTPDWAIEVMDRNLPAATVSELIFSFDGAVVTVPQGAWTPGDIGGYGAVDTLTIRDPAVAADLVAKMRPANRLRVTYAPQGDGDGLATFPLRGVSAAQDAIEARVLVRQE